MDYIFDTHAHYDDEAFDADREEVLAGLKEQGIGTVVNVGASIASTKTTLALAEAHPFMYEMCIRDSRSYRYRYLQRWLRLLHQDMHPFCQVPKT